MNIGGPRVPPEFPRSPPSTTGATGAPSERSLPEPRGIARSRDPADEAAQEAERQFPTAWEPPSDQATRGSE
eukprot:5969848-Prorocentrum_lima.AAC.1